MNFLRNHFQALFPTYVQEEIVPSQGWEDGAMSKVFAVKSEKHGIPRIQWKIGKVYKPACNPSWWLVGMRVPGISWLARGFTLMSSELSERLVNKENWVQNLKPTRDLHIRAYAHICMHIWSYNTHKHMCKRKYLHHRITGKNLPKMPFIQMSSHLLDLIRYLGQSPEFLLFLRTSLFHSVAQLGSKPPVKHF